MMMMMISAVPCVVSLTVQYSLSCVLSLVYLRPYRTAVIHAVLFIVTRTVRYRTLQCYSTYSIEHNSAAAGGGEAAAGGGGGVQGGGWVFKRAAIFIAVKRK